MIIGVVQQHPYAAVSIAVGTVLILVRRYFNGGVCYSKEQLDGNTR